MKLGYILSLLILFSHISIFAQHFTIETQPIFDQSNNILNHLHRVASDVTHQSLAEILTLQEWKDTRPQRYQQFLEMMSLTDVPVEGERSPLNVKIVGTIKKQGYQILKLYYESLPGLYVPANLYIPDKIKKPVPAILYVCGHARTQKVNYQAHPRKFAQLGFVCLIIETIQWGEVLGDHWGNYARGWFHWYSRGYTPAGVELWNAMRGLDLLSQRPEVDAEKLGVTGISGGGAQSWYIAAADPRVKAVAPVCGTGTVEAHIHQRTIDGHCDCMTPINTYLRDYHDIGALIAPRPLLIASANRDGLYSIESVRQVYHYVKDIYELYGESDNISLVETPGGHSYHEISRTKIFSFFLQHLLNKKVPSEKVGDIDESEKVQLSEDELRVYVDGPPKDDRTKIIQDSFVKLADKPVISNERELEEHRNKVRSFLLEKTFAAFPKESVSFNARLEFRSQDGAPFGKNIFSFVSEPDWRLKTDVRWRQSPDTPHPIILVLRSPNENRWASEGYVSGLDDTWNIAYFETRGIGETGWSPELQWHIRRVSAWTGRTIASMRVYDVLRAIEFLRSLEGVQDDKIAIAARDEMGVIALYAALLDENITAVILKNPPQSQNAASNPDGRGQAIEMLNCLRITDLPQVAALLYPSNISFVQTFPTAYLWTEDLYQKLGKAEAVQKISRVSEWKLIQE